MRRCPACIHACFTRLVWELHEPGAQDGLMKRLIAFALVSLALAIGITGCAHDRMSRPSARRAAIVASVVAGVLLLASQVNCANCNIGSDPTARP